MQSDHRFSTRPVFRLVRCDVYRKVVVRKYNDAAEVSRLALEHIRLDIQSARQFRSNGNRAVGAAAPDRFGARENLLAIADDIDKERSGLSGGISLDSEGISRLEYRPVGAQQ